MDKHESQTDYKTGFGGKFGVLQDRQDKVGSNLYIYYKKWWKDFEIMPETV